MNRVQLQRDYVDRIIDGMDMSDLMMIVADYLHENLEEYTDEQLVNEVRDYYPDMLDEDFNGVYYNV